ncbi:Ephrin type-B receptor 3, partial [Geodia barretti]
MLSLAKITEHLGSGEFGTVCKGFWHTNSGRLEVAIKMAQNQATDQDKVRFLQEAATLGQFQHPNIVRLHGVVTVNDPVMILLELMKKGDLKNYLKTLRPAGEMVVQPQMKQRLLRFCTEVALGLEYLAKKSFIHRDIAARNILLADNCTCKIADFGMSRDLEDQDYYCSVGGKVPFKWTAPEALHYRKYSSASDVWSYGVLLWEIWSLGHTPYKDYNTTEEVRQSPA